MTSNSHMPITAIPEVLFEELRQYVDPLKAPTVNHVLQVILEQWLARPQIIIFHEDGEDVKFRTCPLKRVRVTERQYAVAQSVQRQLRSHGRYVPLHVVIFTAVWLNLSAIRTEEFMGEETPAEGVTQDGQLARVKGVLYDHTENQYYTKVMYDDLPKATVVSDQSPDKQ